MKKILIVSYMFPPISGAGTQRPLKFAKYLPTFGIEPIVFCPKIASWKAYDHNIVESAVFSRLTGLPLRDPPACTLLPAAIRAESQPTPLLLPARVEVHLVSRLLQCLVFRMPGQSSRDGRARKKSIAYIPPLRRTAFICSADF